MAESEGETVYETWFEDDETGARRRLYSGTDPVEAVSIGLNSTEEGVTWVTEDHVKIPQTEAW